MVAIDCELASTLIVCGAGVTGEVGSATGRMTPCASVGCASTRAWPPMLACVLVERPLTAKLTPAKAALVASAATVEIDWLLAVMEMLPPVDWTMGASAFVWPTAVMADVVRIEMAPAASAGALPGLAAAP